jgi:PAS domain S-box-containing protein
MTELVNNEALETCDAASFQEFELIFPASLSKIQPSPQRLHRNKCARLNSTIMMRSQTEFQARAMHNQDYHQILQFSNHGIIATDKDGLITFFNNRAEEILHPGRKLTVGTPIWKRMPETGKLVADCLKTGKPQSGSQVFGKNVNLVVNINPIEDDKKVKGAVCNFLTMEEFEITAKSLKSINSLEKQFKTVFESSSDGIWICDHEGKVISINKASEKLGGLKRHEIVGKKVSDIIKNGLYSDYVTDEVIQTKQPVSQLQYIKNTNKTVLCTGIPVLDDAGNLSLVVINERDITLLEAMRMQLEQTRNERERYKNELTELSMQELKDQKVIAESKQMRKVLRTALKIANMEVTGILILGESGTGKGLLAKIIHNCGKRKKRPFIQINCATLPENLLEAELFGYEKGAFSGAATQGKPGLIELANEGTLFLDEVGDLSLPVQAKLLKFLDDNEVMRLGGTKSTTIDCIIIAATNRNLEELVEQKLFREDLFFRLNTITINIPPLRERADDIFELAHHFLQEFNRKYKQKKKISPLTLSLMQAYPFRGNVRELRNLVKKAVIMSGGERIDSLILSSIGNEALEEWSQTTQEGKEINNLVDVLSTLEKEMLKTAKRHCRTTREMAAFLNISQPSVIRKLKKHHLSPNLTHKRTRR